ncbi:MAG: hypothetical protein JKY65_01005 [Planctomycetes bacterium]|nr:hypothetical protein [Planctomycetota bacterium]
MGSSKIVTVGKWILPATVLSLAVAAIVFLGAVELADEFEPSEVASVAPSEAETAPSERSAPVSAPKVAPLSPPPTMARQTAAITQPVSWRRPQPGAARQETAAAGQAATLVVLLARAKDLGARLRLLDSRLGKLPANRAILELEGLLDGVLPGKFAQAEQLRLGVLARLGRYDDPRVEEILIRRLETDLPRPQRLLALELLAARPQAGRGMIASIANNDHDSVVQKKAAWALRHAR